MLCVAQVDLLLKCGKLLLGKREEDKGRKSIPINVLRFFIFEEVRNR